ncbi:MAG: hypothetical protein QM619_16460 [Micropruina sp.]|uniref:hypothetical protein n=1 Tax=Micropruina sp. TaxID=2737536 RepID=UPI0039E6529F
MPQLPSRRRATLTGLSAIVLWSAMVGLIRVVAESFGAALGAALIYTLAAIVLWLVRRPTDVRTFPIAYLLIGGGLFVVYEVTVGLAVGWAADGRQAIEVSIVNYLWPTLMVLLTLLVRRGRRVKSPVVV